MMSGGVIEGERPKRYRILYGGKTIGSYDTTSEAWKGYREHFDLVRPIIDRPKKFTYAFMDGRKELTVEDVRMKWRPK